MCEEEGATCVDNEEWPLNNDIGDIFKDNNDGLDNNNNINNNHNQNDSNNTDAEKNSVIDCDIFNNDNNDGLDNSDINQNDDNDIDATANTHMNESNISKTAEKNSDNDCDIFNNDSLDNNSDINHNDDNDVDATANTHMNESNISKTTATDNGNNNGNLEEGCNNNDDNDNVNTNATTTCVDDDNDSDTIFEGELEEGMCIPKCDTILHCSDSECAKNGQSLHGSRCITCKKRINCHHLKKKQLGTANISDAVMMMTTLYRVIALNVTNAGIRHSPVKDTDCDQWRHGNK